MRRPTLVLTAASALLGFLLVTAVSSVGQARRADAPRKKELIDLIEQRRDLVAEHDRTVSALRDDVDAARREGIRRNEQDRAQGEAVADLALQAGTVALRGRGLEVELSDSPRRSSADGDGDAFRIHDTDLQLVVNALFAAGAEAVSVNDSRLVATTPIRAAGDTIVVNFRPLTPPYRVAAIGADKRAFEDSEIARRFRRWTGLFGLGFRISQGDVEVPAYSGRVAIVSARTP
ncbi:MAG TPA: DUF881 domain-containing protein [Acidimicrobiales bacterium]|nr:DUF881 domain-containing protein [Acidimicrobiales bacterium]